MSYINRQKKGGIDMRLVIGALLLVLTVLLIFFGLRMIFGGGKTDDKAKAVTTEEKEEIPTALKILDKQSVIHEATIRGVSGYQVNGIANVEVSFADYKATVAASLPPIDPASERYEAWMIQPGIADYFSLGSFFPRADGWYGLVYMENLAHVPQNPETYTRILITRESMNADGIPSNVRVAEGFFNL
jgi:hypothetical protein